MVARAGAGERTVSAARVVAASAARPRERNGRKVMVVGYSRFVGGNDVAGMYSTLPANPAGRIRVHRRSAHRAPRSSLARRLHGPTSRAGHCLLYTSDAA